MYVPMTQLSDSLMSLNVSILPLAWAIRVRGDANALRNVITQELQEATGGLTVSRLRQMSDIIGKATANTSFYMFVMSAFGVTAVALAAIGIYGVMAYSLQQRTLEIGIRLALGATPRAVAKALLVAPIGLALGGVVVGLAGAFGLTRLLASLLFGVTARDPWSS